MIEISKKQNIPVKNRESAQKMLFHAIESIQLTISFVPIPDHERELVSSWFRDGIEAIEKAIMEITSVLWESDIISWFLSLVEAVETIEKVIDQINSVQDKTELDQWLLRNTTTSVKTKFDDKSSLQNTPINIQKSATWSFLDSRNLSDQVMIRHLNSSNFHQI